MKISNKSGAYIFISLFIIGVLLSEAYRNKQIDNIKLSPQFTYCIVTKCFKQLKYRSRVHVHYDFLANGKTYSNSRLYRIVDGTNPNILIGKSFRIVYENQNPNNNKILITKFDYRMYGLKFPDSLSWVTNYYYDL